MKKILWLLIAQLIVITTFAQIRKNIQRIDRISEQPVQLPDSSNPCTLKRLSVTNVSIANTNPGTGTLTIVNTINASSVSITKVVADIVCISIAPLGAECIKCNDIPILQNNFIGKNNMLVSAPWQNSGKGYPFKESTTGMSRTLTFLSANSSGVNITGGVMVNHTIGIAPVSCCGDNVTVWIRYTIWDKECNVSDKLVKATISRQGCKIKNTGEDVRQLEFQNEKIEQLKIN